MGLHQGFGFYPPARKPPRQIGQSRLPHVRFSNYFSIYILRDILTFLPGNGMGVGKLLKRWNYCGYRGYWRSVDGFWITLALTSVNLWWGERAIACVTFLFVSNTLPSILTFLPGHSALEPVEKSSVF